jgi:hypothetical protein
MDTHLGAPPQSSQLNEVEGLDVTLPAQCNPLAVGQLHPKHTLLPTTLGLSVISDKRIGTVLTVARPEPDAATTRDFMQERMKVGVVPMNAVGNGCLWLLKAKSFSFGRYPLDAAWRRGGDGGNYLMGWPPFRQGVLNDGDEGEIILVLADEQGIVHAVRKATVSSGFQRLLNRISDSRGISIKDDAEWAQRVDEARATLDAEDPFRSCRVRQIIGVS